MRDTEAYARAHADLTRSGLLSRALEPGRYAAVAVMGVYDADGAFVSSTRVPVEISVG